MALLIIRQEATKLKTSKIKSLILKLMLSFDLQLFNMISTLQIIHLTKQWFPLFSFFETFISRKRNIKGEKLCIKSFLNLIYTYC